jgi:RecA-family ATPase
LNLVEFGASPIPALSDIAIRLTDPIAEGPVDLIPGLMPSKGELVIAGETNIGKSLTALEICSSLVTGNKLWGELEPTRKVKRILYVLGEHYNEVIQRLAQHTRLPFSDEVYLIGPEQLGYDKWLVTSGKPNLQALGKFKKWAEGCDLIVWDPFSAFVTGTDAENDNIGMRLVLDSMSLVAQTVGASCLVLAHQGKPMMTRDGQEHNRKSYAIRGASAIEDAATNIFYLGKAKGESEAALRVANDLIFSLTCRKYKGLAPNEYRLLRDPLTLTHQLLGNRPYVEVKRLAIEGQVGKLVSKLNIGRDEAIRIIAALNDCHERTVRRDLGLP